MSEVFDSAFRTLVNDCSKMILAFLNEAFGENYTGDEEIVFHPNEHFIARQNEKDLKRITDTNFTVAGRKKYHLECESKSYSSRMLIHIFEYDAQIALDQSEINGNTIKLIFPNTAVLYLRSTGRTPKRMKVIIEVPGDKAEYMIPVIKMSDYTLEEIFEKKLYILLPFYIFNFEKRFKEYNKNPEKLEKLLNEIRYIIQKINELIEKGELTAFDSRTIIDLSTEVARQLTEKYDRVKKEVTDVMCGPVIVTEAKMILEQGIEQGETAFAELVKKLLAAGRVQDVEKASSDAEYRHALYQEFGIYCE